jgi:DNA-binding transcriptional MocR family regulator
VSAGPTLSARTVAALLPDVRHLPAPVYGSLASSLATLVLDGRIPPETRIPSERELAASLGLSRATVTAAYDAARADGFLVSRTGAGTFAAVPSDARVRSSVARWRWQTAHPDEIDLTCAALPAPAGLLPRVLREIGDELTGLAAGPGYDPTGLRSLRAAIADRFGSRGVPTSPDEVLVTDGAQHGLDLLLRLLIRPGDRLLTELPTYPGALDAARAHHARLVPVPMAVEGGWNTTELVTSLGRAAARLAYLVPDFHNPTGALVGAEERRLVLRAARRAGTTVVVDESFVELGYDAEPIATAGLDASVVTIGSLSKPIWGGLRVGWLRAPAELVRRLAAQRAALDMSGSMLDQLSAAVIMTQLDDLVEARRDELRLRRDALLCAVGAHLPGWRVRKPLGGLSAWAELDAAYATPLTALAAQEGVQLVPGSRFGVDGTLERFLRLPFALPAPRIEEAIRRIAVAWARLDGSRQGTRPLVVA